MAKYKNYNFYCTDVFGKNGVDEIFNKTIAGVCAKYNVSEKDLDIIACAFDAACDKAYKNGSDNATFED